MNVFLGNVLDRIMQTTRYGEGARQSVSGITGYLDIYEGNIRAKQFAVIINLLTSNPLHCSEAAELYKKQISS